MRTFIKVRKRVDVYTYSINKYFIKFIILKFILRNLACW